MPDNSIRRLRFIHLSISEAPRKQLLTGIVEDFTAKRESYEVLEKFASKKNTVLEILSHDLAGSLNYIKGLTSLLANSLKQYNNPEIDKIVGMIAKTSGRSIHLIREFVKQKFLGSANSAFVKNRVNIVQKVREIMDQYISSEQSIAKNFTYTFSRDPIYIKVDYWVL